MLKLQKISFDHHVNIILRDKDHLCTRSFLIAFALAVALHFSFLFVFHVVPFKLLFNETIFPPVLVETELFFKDAMVITDIEEVSKFVSSLPPFPSSEPLMPEHPTFLSSTNFQASKENINLGNPFTEVEKDIYRPFFNPVTSKNPDPIKIVVSGLLADKKLIHDGLNNSNSFIQLKKKLKESERAIYLVLVEGQTGKIFWYEPIQQTTQKDLNQFAEEVIHQCRFESDSHAFVIPGEIELHFNLEY